jgi:hypothetical protein
MMKHFKFDISELPIAQGQYKSAGVILLSVGILLLILGLVFALMTAGRRDAASHKVKVSAEDCIKRIQTLKLRPRIEAQMIKIAEDDLTRGMELLASSSQAASLCANWTLADYCLGEACEPKGLSMTLRYQDKIVP